MARMRKPVVSPGGALLRASRMFSLPQPINPPPNLATSKSATKGHPTHLAITTPPSARRRGDWGVKYTLPNKMTQRTSTPLIRIINIDTPESIGDFQTAADLSLTLEKFQEMNITMVLPSEPRRNPMIPTYLPSRKSVFEQEHDFTAIHSPLHKHRDLVDKRWNFQGPWIAGLSQQQFLQFSRNKVSQESVRDGFRRYLRRVILADHVKARERGHTDKGTDLPQSGLRPDGSEITREDLTAYIRHLRTKDLLQLCQHVMHFLDIPPYRPDWATAETLVTQAMPSLSPFAEQGPPPCHPSAGISYLRSNAFIENHRLYGPMASHTALSSRTLVPNARSTIPSKMGVGGFVVEPPKSLFLLPPHSRPVSLYESNDSKGWKFWVTAETASIRPSGHVNINTMMAPDESAWVERQSRGEDIHKEVARPITNDRARRGLHSAIRNRAPGFQNILQSVRTRNAFGT